MRQKALIDPMLTDLQIFRSLELDDPWVDAKIPSLYLYLMKNPRLSIPDEWQAQMELLRSELENYVPRMHVDCWNGSCICEIQEAFEIRVGARIQNIHILLRCPDVFGLHSLCSFHLR